jgi:hypothetical protein
MSLKIPNGKEYIPIPYFFISSPSKIWIFGMQSKFWYADKCTIWQRCPDRAGWASLLGFLSSRLPDGLFSNQKSQFG